MVHMEDTQPQIILVHDQKGDVTLTCNSDFLVGERLVGDEEDRLPP